MVSVQRSVTQALGRRMPLAVQAGDSTFAVGGDTAEGGVVYHFATPALNSGDSAHAAQRRLLRGSRTPTPLRRLAATGGTLAAEPPVLSVTLWKSTVGALRTYLGANGRAVHLDMVAADERFGAIAGWSAATPANAALTSGSGGPVVFLSDAVVSAEAGFGSLDEALLALSAGGVPWHAPVTGNGVGTATAVAQFRLASLPVLVELNITSCMSYGANKNIAFRFRQHACALTNIGAAGAGSRRCCIPLPVSRVATPMVVALPLGHGLGASGSGIDARRGASTSLLAWDPRKDACAVWDTVAKVRL